MHYVSILDNDIELNELVCNLLYFWKFIYVSVQFVNDLLSTILIISTRGKLYRGHDTRSDLTTNTYFETHITVDELNDRLMEISFHRIPASILVLKWTIDFPKWLPPMNIQKYSIFS